MISMYEHFRLLGTDEDRAEEDLLQSLLGVLGYARQSFLLRPQDGEKTLKYMLSESLRIRSKIERRLDP